MDVIHAMPNADYHAHPALGSSLIKEVLRTPLHAYAYLNGLARVETPAMKMGTALHTAILEPGRYAAEYRVFEGDRRTKEGKAAYADLLDAGQTPISADDHQTISGVTAMLAAHPTIYELLAGEGLAEVSVFWRENGLDLKCRPDFWRQGVVVDLKSTVDASPFGFARAVARYSYHVQAAHYMAGTECDRFLFVAFEKAAPYACAVYELDADAIARGRDLRERALETLASCVEFGVWPGYATDVQALALPRWAQGEDDDE